MTYFTRHRELVKVGQKKKERKAEGPSEYSNGLILLEMISEIPTRNDF